MLALGSSLLARGHEVLVRGGPGRGRDGDRSGLARAALPPPGGGHPSRRRWHDHDRRAHGRLTGQRLLDVLGMTLENETLSERARELGARLRARRDPECGLEKRLEPQEDDAPDRR